MHRSNRRRSWPRAALAAAAAVLATGAGLVAANHAGAEEAAAAATGIRVSGTKILESTGDAFVFRGVNHAHTWYTHQFSSFANIKSLGANSVRVVLSDGTRWTKNDATDVANVIAECKKNKLICVLEVHDTTGYGEQAGAGTLSQAADYWISIQSALTGQEAYTVLNIGNEPWGNQNSSGWTSATTGAIQKLRSAGFKHSIMVDAPNWGQDWQGIMRDNASTVFAADSEKNTIFSVHMYGVYGTSSAIKNYFDAFASKGLPLVVGEFGNNHSDGDVDEDTILSEAQSRGIGWLGWSWSGNGGGVEYLDLVNSFNKDSLSTWGQRLFNGSNGIKATSKEAKVFGGGTTDPTTDPTSPSPSSSPSSSPSTDPTDPVPTGGCTATYATAGDWGSGFQGTVTVKAGSSAINGWTVKWTWPNGQRVTQSWNATVSGSDAVTATNVSYNGKLAAGASTQWGFIGSRGSANGAPTPTCTAS